MKINSSWWKIIISEALQLESIFKVHPSIWLGRLKLRLVKPFKVERMNRPHMFRRNFWETSLNSLIRGWRTAILSFPRKEWFRHSRTKEPKLSLIIRVPLSLISTNTHQEICKNWSGNPEAKITANNISKTKEIQMHQ